MPFTYRLPPALNCNTPNPVLTHCRGGTPASFSLANFTSSYPNAIGEIPVHPFWGAVYDNYYVQTETSTSISQCTPTRGWHAVLGMKTWHGCFGYLNQDYCTDCFDFVDGLGFPFYYNCCLEPIHDSPPDPKYLTVTVLAKGYDFDYTGDPADIMSIAQISASVTVDRYSGKATATFNQAFSTGSGGSGSYASESLALDVKNRAIALVQATCVNQLYAPGKPDQCNNDGNIWNWSGLWLPCCGLCSPWFGGAATSFTDSSATSTLHYRITPPMSFSIDVSVTFSDTFSSANLNADADGVAGIYLFRELLPNDWRTDNNFSMVPCCKWDESPFATNPIPIMVSLLGAGSYTDTSPWTGTGIGYILPSQYTSGSGQTISASYGQYYQKYHQNWSYSDFTLAWTMTGTGSWVPTTCKRATEFAPDYMQGSSVTANLKGGYKMFSYPSIGDDVLYVRKYAEILLNNRPSHNWSKPYLEANSNDKNQLSSDCSAGSSADLFYSGSQFTAYISGSVNAFANPSGSLRWGALPSISSSATMSFYDDTKKKQEFILNAWTYDRGYKETLRYSASFPASGSNCYQYYTPVPVTRRGAKDLATVAANTYNIAYDPCKINFIMVIGAGDTQEQNDQFFLPFMYNTNYGVEYWMYDLAADKRYGSKYFKDVIPIMTDPLWQAPASPCVLSGSPVSGQIDCSGTALQFWNEDDGRTIYESNVAVAGGAMCNNDSITPANRCYRWYPFRPLNEARTGPPIDACTDLSASALPSGSRALNDCSTYTTTWNASPSDVPITDPYKYCEFCNEPSPYVDTRGYGTYYMYNWAITGLQESCLLSDGRFADIYAANLGYANVPTILL